MRRAAFTAGLACALASRASLAADPEPAQEIFDKGVAQMEAGRFAIACPAIERSYRLEPLPGTLFTLAECEAKRGRLSVALARYEEYLALYASLPADKKARQSRRLAITRAQKADLEKRTPTLKVVLPADAPKGTVVTRDDLPLGAGELGTAVRIDPGEHTIEATAPGKPPWQRTVKASEGAQIEMIVLSFGAPVTVIAPPPAPPEKSADGRTQRLSAGVTGGVGIASVVAGAALGFVAKSTWSDVLAHCTDPANARGCRPSDADKLGTATRLADASTATFVIGGAAIVTAGVLWLTAPPTKPAPSAAWRFTPVISRGAAAGVIEGRF